MLGMSTSSLFSFVRPLSFVAAVAVLPLSGAGCAGEDGTEPNPSPDAAPIALRLDFAAVVGDEAAACGQTYTQLGANGHTAELADARMYVSNVELQSDAGEWVGLTLDETDWQTANIALVDFEDGTAGCSDSGTADTNTTLTGTIADDTYTAVRFDIGVPFEKNHLDNATADSPLNAPGMFWVWQTGYKFARFDLLVDEGDLARWNVHVGSTQCTSDARTEAPDEPCARSNRSHVVLDDFDVDADEIVFDIGALVQNADLGTNLVDTPPGCMSSPMEADDCSPVFSDMGLDFASGDCVDGCDAQSILSVR